MKLPILFLSIAIAGYSCQSSTNTNAGTIDSIIHAGRTAAEQAKNKPVKDYSGRYMMIINRDTSVLQLAIEGNKATGNLTCRRYEKDNNDGTIQGQINDSLIIADYTFRSEGVVSVRQVAFKIRGNTLLQGYGEERVKNDTAVFRNTSLLVFDSKHPFIKE